MARKKKSDIETAEALGDWYDENSTADEDAEPVKVKAKRKYDPTFTVRLPREYLDRLKDLADKSGVPAATLGRSYLIGAIDRAMDPTREVAQLLAVLASDERLRSVLRALASGDDDRELAKARHALAEAATGGQGATMTMNTEPPSAVRRVGRFRVHEGGGR